MNMYIAFLRAINVGGRMLKMEQLRNWLVAEGYMGVQTYIQSGNIVFCHLSVNIKSLENNISTLLKGKLGFDVAVFIYTPSQLQHILKYCPFTNVPDNEAIHVSMLSAEPDKELMAGLEVFQNEHEQYRLHGTVMYVKVLKGKYGETKFSNTFLEKKLKVQATTRNWATMSKMAEYQ